MKKTAKSSKTIRANKRKAKLKVKHRRQRERGPPDEPGWQGSMLAPSENPVTRRGYHLAGSAWLLGRRLDVSLVRRGFAELLRRPSDRP